MHILITGATGQLGRELVPRLLKRGDRLTLLVRDAAKAGRLFPGCALAVGDVVLDGFGLKKPLRPDAVWHLAADINLGSSQDDRVWAVNYGGTVNAVNFCLRNSVQRLVYSGTAFTEKGRNSYEKSKKAAEQAVEAAAIPHKTIFKLGLLVPGSPEDAGPSGGALYLFINVLCGVLDRAALAGGTFRIKGDPGACMNLVHSDLAADFMARASGPGKFWLTHPDPIKLAELTEWVGGVLKANVTFEPEFRMSRAEALFNKLAKPFLPYMWGEDFPSHMTGAARITEQFIKRSAEVSITAFRNCAKTQGAKGVR